MSTARNQVGLSTATGSLGRERSISDSIRRGVKRGFDLSAAAVLLFVAAPLIACVGLAVKLDSAGPAFFCQTRIGRNRRRHEFPFAGLERRRKDTFGQPFSMVKFRTMHVDASVYAVSPVDGHDSRITRVGRFLRATCLDELPQLLNVLVGHMSLVGPRPEMPFIVRGYRSIHRRRLEVRPGITCLWQIEGPRDRPIHESIEYDLQYIDQWSLRLDAKLLVRTALFVLKARNF